jgi:hypothetical protein
LAEGASFATLQQQHAAVSSRYVYLPKPVVVLVSQEVVENYVAIRVRLKAYVMDTKFEKAFVNDVTLRVLDSFSDLGIQPPAILHRRIEDLDSGQTTDLRVAGS